MVHSRRGGFGPLPELDLSVDAEDFLFEHESKLKEGVTFPQIMRMVERAFGQEVSTDTVRKVLRELQEVGLVKSKIARSSSLGGTTLVFSLTSQGEHTLEALQGN